MSWIKSMAARSAAAVLAAASILGAAHAEEFTGAGATFPAPIYQRWAEQYSAQGGDTLNYQSIGSGAGVTQIVNRTVDFGASDAPVKSERLTEENLLQFPGVIGAVVVIVNVPGVDGARLRLTGPLIAEMYLGRVRMWNAPQIRQLNPDIALPAAAIAPVYRSDGSGTTSVFTHYLAATSLRFEDMTGAGTSVPWRAGIGAPGNAGVAGAVENTRGGIGYVEYAYAHSNDLQTPQLRNRSGHYLSPSPETFAAASAQADWAGARDLAANIINRSGEDSWPIVSASYILIPRNPANAERTRRVLRFFDWAFRHGGPAAHDLDYLTLPASVQDAVRARWAEIRVGGQPVWTPGS